jgi:uncharacterized protein YkwD
MIGRLRRHLRIRFGAAALLAAIAGCQDQPTDGGTPVGGSDPLNPQSFSARVFLADPCYDVPNEGALIRELVKAVNAERTKQKLTPLRINDTLAQLAEYYACRLADSAFFNHVDPVYGTTVESRAADFGYAFLWIGENLAAGQETAEQVVAEWMTSPDHEKVLLNPAFTETGISIKKGGPGGPYWVQEFGRPVTAGEEGPALLASPTSATADNATKPMPAALP